MLVVLQIEKNNFWQKAICYYVLQATELLLSFHLVIPFLRIYPKGKTWIRELTGEFLLCLNRLRTWPVSVRMQIWALGSLNGLSILCYHKLQHRLQMWPRSGIATAVSLTCSCSSSSAPHLGNSICHSCGHKKKKLRCCLGIWGKLGWLRMV